MGLVVGSTLAIIGYAVGWILALSVPEGVPRIPILISMTGIGSGRVLGYDMKQAADRVKRENSRVAKLIGINLSLIHI